MAMALFRAMNINEPHQGVALALPFTAAADPEQREAQPQGHIPFLKRVPDTIRNHFVAMSGEYVGTVSTFSHPICDLMQRATSSLAPPVPILTSCAGAISLLRSRWDASRKQYSELVGTVCIGDW